MKKFVLTLLVLAGCSTNQVVVEKPVVIPPKKPQPIITHKVSFIQHPNNEPYLLLHVEDGVRMKEQTVDTIRYIKELQGIVCFYESSYDFCNKGARK